MARGFTDAAEQGYVAILPHEHGITFLHLGDCLQPLAAARQALAVHCRVSSFTVSVGSLCWKPEIEWR